MKFESDNKYLRQFIKSFPDFRKLNIRQTKYIKHLKT
jgi:hypothetical protein